MPPRADRRLSPLQRLTGRVFVGTAALILVVLVVVLAVATVSARRTTRDAAEQALEQSSDLVAQLLAGRGRSLAGGARVFVQGPYFRTLVAEQRRDDILDQTFEAADQLEASWVFITDANGTLVAKSDEPSAVGESLANVALVSGALRGNVTSGFGGSGDSLLFQATAVPIAAPGGMPFGVLVATRVIDSLVAADIALATNRDVLFYVRAPDGTTRIAASSLPAQAPQQRALANALTYASGHTDSVSARTVASARAGADPTRGHHSIVSDSGAWRWYGAALTTAGGMPVGGYLVMQPVDDTPAGLGIIRTSLAIAALCGLICALLAAWLTARVIARPVEALASQVEALLERREAVPTASHVQGAIVRHDMPARHASELTKLAGAVNALVVDTHDQEVVRHALTQVAGRAQANTPQQQQRTRAGARPGSAAGVLSLGVASNAPPTSMVGALLANRYQLLAQVGAGGLGAVYRAWDTVLEETVAIKLLRPEAMAAGIDATALLAAEVRLARRISHRHVIRLHDIGDAEGLPFLSMQFVEGTSLAAMVQGHGSLPASLVVALARQLLRGLAAAHAEGVVHGDIKPHNILVSHAGIAMLADFGLARLARAGTTPSRSSSERTDLASVQGALYGATIGTPAYMAPELLIGAEPTEASDLYAMGMVLHACVIGLTPADQETPVGLLGGKLTGADHAATRQQSLSEAARARRARQVVAPIDELITAMTHPDPRQRPSETRRLLDAWLAVDISRPGPIAVSGTLRE